jgi:hypothetical protein
VNGFVKGELNLKSLQKYLPIFSSNELKGVLNANIFMKGKMSDMDDKNYKNVRMNGNIKLRDFSWNKTNRNINVNTLNAILTPENLNFPFVKGSYNGNKLSISGKISNVLAYFSPLNTLKGSFVISAEETNIDKWMITEKNSKNNEFIKIEKEDNLSQKMEKTSSTLKMPYDFDIIYKAVKLKYQGNSLDNFSFKGNYKLNILNIQNLSFKYNKIGIKSSGKLLNADNYLFNNGILSGKLNIFASNFPFILPSSDLVSQSISKPVIEEPSLLNKIIPVITKKDIKKSISLIPERTEVLGNIKIDSILSSDQVFNNISFQISLKKEYIKMFNGIAFNKNMPIYWQGILNRQNNFSVKFDFNKFQTDLFSIPEQSPLQLFNLTSADKSNRPAGLKISGNIGNAPDYNFSKLNYLFFINMNSLLEDSQIQPFLGLKSQKKQEVADNLKWWISYENKKFIFWPIYLKFKDIPFYFTGFQQGDKECYFKIKGLIPMSYFKMEEWIKLNNIDNYPEMVEVTIDIEDCLTDKFTLQIQIQPNLNENLKIRLEKFLKFELNRELRRIYAEDKLKNSLKQNTKERYNYLPSYYTSSNFSTWNDYFKLSDSLQSSFNTLKPRLK